MDVDARKLPGEIQWHEGMFLAPQHFQQMSLRNSALLQYHISILSPYNWGVLRLKIDRTLLVNGVFRVLELEAVMPDGLVVMHDAEFGDLQLDLKDPAIEWTDKPMTVYCTVVATRSNSMLVGGDLPRFTSVTGAPLVDYNTGDGEIEAPVLRPIMKLHVGDVPEAKYVALPLAQVSFRERRFDLEEYIPPTVRIRAQLPPKASLHEITQSVATRLREKATYLAAELHERHYDMEEWEVQSKQQFLAALTEILPFLEASIHQEAHPLPAYMALSLVAGHVALLGIEMVPPSFSGYLHNNLLAAFTELRTYIFRTISEGVLETHHVIDFDNTPDPGTKRSHFSLQMQPGWLNDTLLIGVKGIPKKTERDILIWMQDAQIGSQSKLKELMGNRIIGARRKQDPDRAIVTAHGMVFFVIENDKENIVREEVLHIVNLTREDIISEIKLFVPKN